MLPFPKRKTPEEMELGDDDLVVLEDVADEVDVDLDFVDVAGGDVDLAQTVQRKRPSMLLPSTRAIDERLEDDVAGQCLASIAAEVRSPQSASGIRAVLAAAPPPPVLPPPSSVSPPMQVPMHVPGQARDEMSASYTIPPHARLPRVTAPPFVRTREPFAPPGLRESTPPAAFARRSSASLPAVRPAMSTAPMMPLARPATTSDMPPPAVHSIAPTHIPAEARAVEPTVIVVRERPKAGWIIASAAIGALCALAAAKVLVSSPREEASPAREVATTTIATAVVAGPAAAPPAATVVVPITPSPALAHPVPATSATTVASGAVVRFGDEQGIAIAAPKPAGATAPPASSDRPAAKPASAPKQAAPARPAPAKPGKAPSNALPDGSFPLGQATESKSATAAAPASPPASTPSQAEKAAQSALASTILSSANTPPGTAPSTRPAPASAPEAAPAPAPRRRPMTPEQQIADAQLKASMK